MTETNATSLKASKVLSIINQKGGVAKTTTCIALGAALARKGESVLLIDADPQSSLTISLGQNNPDEIKYTISDKISEVINNIDSDPLSGILKSEEGFDFLPANIDLARYELSLSNELSRERVFAAFVERLRPHYDRILIDTGPSLGLLSVNSLVAADGVIVPVSTQYLSARGMEYLLETVSNVRRKLNSNLKAIGILITMADSRTNNSKEIASDIREVFGTQLGLNVFDTAIPYTVKVAEAPKHGESVLAYAPNSPAAQAYGQLVKEVF